MMKVRNSVSDYALLPAISLPMTTRSHGGLAPPHLRAHDHVVVAAARVIGAFGVALACVPRRVLDAAVEGARGTSSG